MSGTPTTAGLFDRWSETYDGEALQRFTYRPLHDAVLKELRSSNPQSILDLGCGTGQLLERLHTEFPSAHIAGLDYSFAMLGKANERTNQPLLQSDANDLPFAAASFDAITCTESFHWYPDQQGTMHQLANLLRPGGVLIIGSIATFGSPGRRLIERASTRFGQPIRALTANEITSLAGSAELTVDSQRRVPRLAPIPLPLLTVARKPNGSSGSIHR